MADGPLQVVAPVAGRVIPLADVPDPVFAGGMVGPGSAISPDLQGSAPAVDAVAPIDGVIAALHPHAFVVAGPGGGTRGVLVHLGIDTVQLKGLGFTLLLAQGDEVSAGQSVISWSPAGVAAGGHSPVVPVIALAADPEHLELSSLDAVAAGEPLLRWLDLD